MCNACYIRYGSPSIVNERTRAAAALVDRIYDHSCVGANAHIVTDDWNLEDSHIDWCLKEALAENYHQSTPDQLAIEKAALESLRALTMDERASAMAIHDKILT